ncbi:hypothetical protein [Nocardia nova]
MYTTREIGDQVTIIVEAFYDHGLNERGDDVAQLIYSVIGTRELGTLAWRAAELAPLAHAAADTEPNRDAAAALARVATAAATLATLAAA